MTCRVSSRGCRQLLRSALGLSAILLLSATLFAQLPRPVSTPVGPEHDDPLARELWFQRGRIVPRKPGAAAQFLRHAYQQKMKLRAARLKVTGAAMTAYSGALTTPTPSSASTTSYGGWVPLGPAPINSNSTGSLDDQDYGPVVGRATSVVVDPGDPTGNTVYVGGAYGGVWKSTNAAASDPSAVTWTPLTDQQATLATGSLAVQPSSSGPGSVILVGTGEADFSIDSYYGLGILRSADAGNTWTMIGSSTSGISFFGLAFAKISFSTDNPNLVVAAATGAGNNEGAGSLASSTGLYTSTDGGQSWTLTQSGLVQGVGPTSVVYDSAAHKFLAFQQFQGYFSSRDGVSWTRLASQPGAALRNCPIGNTGVPVCNVFRGEMAVVPGREELYTWYVTIDDQGNIGDGGIYKTTNGGSTWQQVSDTGITNCGDGTNNGCGAEQGWFNLTLAAVPNGSGTDLYAGAVNLYKCSITAANSLCATKPFINLTHVYGCTPLGSLAHVHPDQHDMSFLQLSPSQVVVYFANDGGIYRALNGYGLKSGTCGAAPNAFQNLNGTMGSMAQFVDFSNSPTDAATLLGGTQDNGSPATDATYGSKWISVNAGDGGYNAIDPASGNWFTSNTDVSVQRCGAGINCLAQTFDPIVTNSTLGGDHGFFYTPFILDPQATSRMMVGTCRLWRGNSDGSGFTPLSYNFDTVMNQVPNQACSGNEGQLIRSIAGGGPNTGNGSSVLYVGTEGGFTAAGSIINGNIWVTNNADLGPFTWLNVFNSGSPFSSIAVDASDPTGNTAYATVMGFGITHILQTSDQGLTWRQFSSQLPNTPANVILIDPDDSSTFYVGTDVGVYTTHDLTNWSELGQLPNVAVLQLHMFESGGVKQLRAGTYGRGVWSYDIPYQIRIATPRVQLLPGQTGTINGVITGYNGYSSPVTIACPSNVVFATCNSVSVTPTPSGTSFSLTLTASSSPGGSADYTFALQGTGSDPSATVETALVTVIITNPSFGGTVTLNVNQGATSTRADLFPGGFDQPITFSCSNLPPGVSCNFFPSAVVPPSIVLESLTVSAASNTPLGSYSVNIDAASPDLPAPKTELLSLTVGSNPDYSLAVTPPTGTLLRGSPLTGYITLTPVGGYSGPVTISDFSPYGLVGVSLSPSGPITLAGAPVTVAVSFSYVASSSGGGVMPISFSATSPNTDTHYAVMNVPVADFMVYARIASSSISPGQQGQYELFVSSVGVPSTISVPFANPVSFSCSGLPAGTSCSFSPATVTPNNSQAVVVLSVTTPKTLASMRPPATATQAQLLLALLLPGMVIAISGNVRRKKKVFVALLIVVLALAILMPACGGGGSSSGPPAPQPPPPPPPSSPPPLVSYNFTVTATSGTVQRQVPLTLVVQGK